MRQNICGNWYRAFVWKYHHSDTRCYILDTIILMDPFHLMVFYGSMVLRYDFWCVLLSCIQITVFLTQALCVTLCWPRVTWGKSVYVSWDEHLFVTLSIQKSYCPKPTLFPVTAIIHRLWSLPEKSLIEESAEGNNFSTVVQLCECKSLWSIDHRV